jgi:CRISPR-associated endonuclease Cas2
MAKQMEILCSESTLYNAWSVVKAKGAAGGIDGVTIQEFEKEKRKQIPMLVEELKSGTWKPYPYLEIEIPKSKDPAEKRKLGMIAIRDKIVQQAIRAIIEPRYDRIFVGNSYGYRPGKGATKAIKRVLAECKNKKYKYVLRLDIDNFFDTIDHFLLRRRLAGTGTEEEISDDKRRRQVVKLMESIGTRMNFSVFECMLTDIQYQSMCKRLARLVVRREDWVNIYPLCTECYARIEYIPPVKKKEPVKIAVV